MLKKRDKAHRPSDVVSNRVVNVFQGGTDELVCRCMEVEHGQSKFARATPRPYDPPGHGTTLVWMLVGLLVLVVGTTGCTDVSMRRFSPTTRIDLTVNPGWDECPEPFETQLARVRGKRLVVCDQPAVAQRIVEIVSKYEEDWENWWAWPPEPPPVVLVFYEGTRWLGTLDLYDAALGHVGNLLHDIEPGEASLVLRLMCDCAEGKETPDTDWVPANGDRAFGSDQARTGHDG